MLFGGRYIVFLMGLFSIYTGFIYNDIFSKSINVFGTKWTVSTQPNIDEWLKTAKDSDTIKLDPNYTTSNVYPYGMDPMWQLATNKIMFIDSFKMKSSVILGVVQMSFGLALPTALVGTLSDRFAHLTLLAVREDWGVIKQCV